MTVDVSLCGGFHAKRLLSFPEATVDGRGGTPPFSAPPEEIRRNVRDGAAVAGRTEPDGTPSSGNLGNEIESLADQIALFSTSKIFLYEAPFDNPLKHEDERAEVIRRRVSDGSAVAGWAKPEDMPSR